MKKQYKALANQAGFSHCTPTVAKWLEKYAELIIAECISACATDKLGKTASAEDLIKEHFGKHNDV